MARPWLRTSIIAVVMSVAFVCVLDALTNERNPEWDGLHYLEIARNGIRFDRQYASPFPYRSAAPMIAHGIRAMTGWSAEIILRVMVRAAIVAMLLMTLALCRSIGASWRSSAFIAAFIGLHYAHAKFALYFWSLVDVYGYAVMFAATWALMSRRYRIALFLGAAGVLFKEFLVAPAFIAACALVWQAYRERTWRPMAWAAAGIFLLVCCVALPRLAIPIGEHYEVFDPLWGGGWRQQVSEILANTARNANIVYSLLGYGLPAMLLATRARTRSVVKSEIAAWPCAGLVVVVLLLMLFGGTNLCLYPPYLAALLVACLAVMARGGDIGWVEGVIVLAVIAGFNRVWQTIPTDYSNYLAFYGGYNNLPTATWRWVVCVCALLAGTLRQGCRTADAGSAMHSPIPSPRTTGRWRP